MRFKLVIFWQVILLGLQLSNLISWPTLVVFSPIILAFAWFAYIIIRGTILFFKEPWTDHDH